MNDRSPLTLAELNHFTGTEHYYRHSINRKILFTDGVQYLADKAGAYWLVDEIALLQRSSRRVAAEEFQVWILRVELDHTASLRCEDGDGHLVFSKRIAFTDFPLPEVTLWFAHEVIYLPSEH